MTDWDSRWMEFAKMVASWSKDHSRKVGAVIVHGKNEHRGFGYNDFPAGVQDDVAERRARPQKYFWTVHAELNAILNSNSPTAGCKMYCTLFPCARCAGAIVQAKIAEIIAPEPDMSDPNFADEFRVSLQMFEEAGIAVRFI